MSNPYKLLGYNVPINHTLKFVIKKNKILAYIDVLKIEKLDIFDLIFIPKGIIIRKAIYTDIVI